MKIAPLVHEIRARYRRKIRCRVVHTGQHYDYRMSEVFFRDLSMPAPDYYLGAGSGTHARQTAKIMIEFEKICAKERPDLVAVVGDVNSTLACSVTAKKMNIRVAHIEAGLRSFDRTMPEEINRIVTDALSDLLFVTERSAMENLRREGKKKSQIFFVGNVMIDSLFHCLRKIRAEGRGGRRSSPFAVLTLHRPSNVDVRDTLGQILKAVREISFDMPVYFPIHPRTAKNVERFGFGRLVDPDRIKVTPPLSYLDFLRLWSRACLVLTDSGGIQEETTALGIPCFTIRENTERPITVSVGTNTLVGTTAGGILRAYARFKNGRIKKGSIPELWDGRAAQRILRNLVRK
jgi:UDP-N-acetylglucosamine 2-epimerase (non-hydrolysing)